MKYDNNSTSIRVTGDTGYTIIKADRSRSPFRWEAPNGATLEELKDAISFLETNPLPDDYETKVKKAPIGTRAQGINGNTSFFLKIANDKWYFYGTRNLTKPYGGINGLHEYTDRQIGTIYSLSYKIKENA